jgi:hypothetical protein
MRGSQPCMARRIWPAPDIGTTTGSVASGVEVI